VYGFPPGVFLSNLGASAKLFAPGTEILSTWKDGNKSPNDCEQGLYPVFANATVRDFFSFQCIPSQLAAFLLSINFAG
jgi:hypothetical protein